MADPTSDVGESDGEGPDCATCGTAVGDSDDRRVITWVDDGEVQAVHFCDETCRRNWSGE